MEANEIKIKDKMPASRKLQSDDAVNLLDTVSKLIALKGKKVTEFSVKNEVFDEAIAATLGPTGNLRAPTLRVGKTLIVGFNEEAYKKVFS